MIHILPKLDPYELKLVNDINVHIREWDFSRNPKMQITVPAFGFRGSLGPTPDEIFNRLKPYYKDFGYLFEIKSSGESVWTITRR